MPFTTSHPAVVLPLKKLWPDYFSLAGLMAGALSPDLIYFLTMTTVDRGISHSWTGLFIFCLPAGLLFSFAFHYLFKYHFIVNLPHPLDRYFSGLAVSDFCPKRSRQWVMLLLSILVGAFSHFFWDSFTHNGGEIARHLKFLTTTVPIFGIQVPVTRILQHTSTLVGGIFIAAYFWKGKSMPPPVTLTDNRSAKDKLLFWLGAVTMSILFVILVSFVYRTYFPHLLPRPVTTMGLASWAGFFWSVVVYTILKRLFSRKLARLENI